jgi:hypothetical protein
MGIGAILSRPDGESEGRRQPKNLHRRDAETLRNTNTNAKPEDAEVAEDAEGRLAPWGDAAGIWRIAHPLQTFRKTTANW